MTNRKTTMGSVNDESNSLISWMFLLILSVLFISGRSFPAFAEELVPDEHTLLLLHFNGTLNGVNGETPISASGESFEEGVLGQGVYLPTGNKIFYESLDNIDATEGTLEFWIKPRWAGDDNQSHYLLKYGSAGGMLFGKDGGNFWRCILNRYGPGGSDEVGTGLYVQDWQSNQWHHAAFTWDQYAIKVYIDGKLKAETELTTDLPAVGEDNFQIGADGDSNPFDAVVDELHISSIARSTAEIEEHFIKGLTIQELSIQPDSVQLFETWHQETQLVALTNMGIVNLTPEVADWSSAAPDVASVDAQGRITARSAGNTTITATIDAILAEVAVEVINPVLDPEVETIDPFLSIPATNYLYEIPVVIIRYLPTQDGTNLDESVTGYSSTLADLKTKIDRFEKRIKFMIEEGSRYHGYKNPAAIPSLGYRVVHIVTVYEEVQKGFPVPWNPGWYRPDYNQILTRFDAETFVNDLGVKEFWIWTWHHGGIEPAESNMSSPLTGDISNSERYNDDLPIYDHTYTVYNYNFTRSQSEAVHNHGHQLEAILGHVNQIQDDKTDLFWKKFVGQDESGNVITGRCGWTHMPPNTTVHYDYLNPTLVESDIEDWKPDEPGGDKKAVNVDTWGNLEFNWPDGVEDFEQRKEAQWYIYWMQNMPGFRNVVPYNDSYMTNWWIFSADWDQALSAPFGLHRTECLGDFDFDGDMDGFDLSAWSIDLPLIDVGSFLAGFGKSDCPALAY